MKRFFSGLAMTTALLASVPAQAQSTPTSILEEIGSAIGPSALANISKAEQVFCYQVADRTPGYEGYTIDGFAITGFCGIIPEELKNIITTELFSNQDNILFDVTENCTIRPRIMLRFVRGIDNTDILLSSPCHSFTIFYAGKINTFNAKPASQVIDGLVNPLSQSHVEFSSPALFNQLMPVGLPQTKEQLEKFNSQGAPLRNWEQTSSSTDEPKTQGWNKLKKSN
ncbi:MAG: hypothetical protein E7012_00805 [Alphaproteobacteria bacterium]|nr:hypothetical protein [Alphaproteobacteria bacterium]